MMDLMADQSRNHMSPHQVSFFLRFDPKNKLIYPVPSSRPIPSISPAQTRLAQAIAELKITKSENEHTVEVASAELASLEEQEKDLRQEVERVEGKREWVEEFRGWVETLGLFLEEKVNPYGTRYRI